MVYERDIDKNMERTSQKRHKNVIAPIETQTVTATF